MKYERDDGGRSAAGFRGETGDCVTRAIAIATGMPYREVYDGLNRLAKESGRGSCSRTGVPRRIYDRYLARLGWQWVATMRVGQGCRVHLDAAELPHGRLVVKCSRHLVAVVNGTAHDTHDPRRGGSRCVYGYWREPVGEAAQD